MESTTISTSTGITKSVSKAPVTFRRIFKNGFQKPNTLTVEVEQKVTTIASYPSMKIESNLNQGISDIAEFKGGAPTVYASPSTRIAWMIVPDHYTEEIAKAKLAEYPEGCVYRILSNEPILDDNQQFAVDRGLKTKDSFANTQAVRYPKGDDKEGKLVLKNGKVQYKVTKFWRTPHADEDFCGISEVYLSAELNAELNGASVLTGQSI
jgi:hypothetical protein